MIQYEEHSIEERLQYLYSRDDAKRAFIEIKFLINKYKKIIDSREYHLTQKDVILITYGNQVIESTEAPLDSLQKFLDRYIEGVINTLHILPFYPYSSDDGFSVANYYEVSPLLGSWREIEAIASKYRIMVDGVVNHVSRYSYWFKRFLANDPRYKKFFIDLDPSTDLSQVIRPRTSPLLTPFKDDDGELHYIWTTFSKDQVDLNYANYEVLVKIIDVLFFYVSKGAKLIRLDAIAFLWKEMGSSCVHLQQTHELVQLFREIIHEVAPEVVIITETNVPHDENISYFGNGDDEAQMVYNFTLPPLLAHGILRGSAEHLSEWASTLRLPSDKVCFFNFTASHDGIGLRPASEHLPQKEIDFLVDTAQLHGGFISYRDDENGEQKPYELNSNYMDLLTHPDEDDSVRIKRMILSQAVVMAMPGVPGIYFHSLVGSGNHLGGVEMTGVKRSINRQKIFWHNLKERLDTAGSIGNVIFHTMKRLLSIRVNERSFNPFGPFEFPSLDKRVFTIVQTAVEGDERIIALHNLSEKSVTLTLPDFTVHGVNLLNREEITTAEITLEAYEIAWIKFTYSTIPTKY